MTRLRVGTRGSQLALAQSALVAERLCAAHPQLEVSLVEIVTAGDRDQSSALNEGVGWFTTAIQDALRRNEIDLAVHSYKDLPTSRPEGLVIAAVPLREDPRDAMVSRAFGSLGELPPGAVIGTSSPRREAQLRAIRPDLEYRPIRGNVDTRIRKVDAGEYDATVLALAGLRRLGLEARATQIFGVDEMLPAPAQGALAIECRADDGETLRHIAAIDDPGLRQVVAAERSFLAAVDVGCQFPAGAYAQPLGSTLRLQGLLANDGNVVRSGADGPSDTAEELGRTLAQELMRLVGLAPRS